MAKNVRGLSCNPPPSSSSSSSSCLPASSLSCSRCGVAIATEKCGNTSVLQSAGERERETEIEASREKEGEDGRQTESEGADTRRGEEERKGKGRKYGKDC